MSTRTMITAPVALIVVCLALFHFGWGLVACGSATSAEESVTSVAGSSTTPTTVGWGGPTSSPSSETTGSTAPGSSAIAPLEATSVVENLRVVWEMRFMPDGRLLVSERGGRIVIADVTSGEVTEVGNLEVLARGEGGLMGLDLDPDFPETPDVYVVYTYSNGDEGNRISRLTLTGLDSGAPAIAGETVILDRLPAGPIHDGSRVAFGPDGYLWVTMGDTGNGELAQRMDSLGGKVLRMTRDGQPAPDNPFLDEPYPFSLIYTLGHRNPQGLTFHPGTNQAYVTEHGPSENDEVNRLEPGGNYGWPGSSGVVEEPGFVDPIMTWTPTIAPAAAVFYDGGLIDGLGGQFLLVTLKERDLRVLVPVDSADFTQVAEERVLLDEEFGRLRAIAVGPDGVLYLGTSNHDGRGQVRDGDDRIIRVVPER